MFNSKNFDKAKISSLIKKKAAQLGFDECGIAKAEKLKENEFFFRNFLKSGYHGNMTYLEKNIDNRLDPRLLIKNTKSIIVVALNYYNGIDKSANKKIPKISMYAQSDKNYHEVITSKLYKLLEFINTKVKVQGKAIVDSAPVLEKAWAKNAGIGWQGKNSIMINKKLGSYFFIGELLIDIILEYDEPYMEDLCISCTKCLEACPTKALIKPKVLNATKCIAYQTIENKKEIPISFRDKFDNYIFGCDICQMVCPWNKTHRLKETKVFTPHPKLTTMMKDDWGKISQKEFNKLFKYTEFERLGYKRLKRNLDFIGRN